MKDERLTVNNCLIVLSYILLFFVLNEGLRA